MSKALTSIVWSSSDNPIIVNPKTVDFDDARFTLQRSVSGGRVILTISDEESPTLLMYKINHLNGTWYSPFFTSDFADNVQGRTRFYTGAGTIKNMRMFLGTSVSARLQTFTISKNGVDTDLSIAVTSDAGFGTVAVLTDTTNTVTTDSDDYIEIKMVFNNASASNITWLTCDFIPA